MWRDISSAYQLRPDEYRLLEEACREIDLIERLEAELRETSTTTRGSQGQTVAAPQLSELRQHRTVLARLFSQLKLPDVAAQQTAGDRSASARQTAALRWGKRGA
jgi:hypothetical protein